jgi:hypothetical protein
MNVCYVCSVKRLVAIRNDLYVKEQSGIFSGVLPDRIHLGSTGDGRNGLSPFFMPK